MAGQDRFEVRIRAQDVEPSRVKRTSGGRGDIMRGAILAATREKPISLRELAELHASLPGGERGGTVKNVAAYCQPSWWTAWTGATLYMAGRPAEPDTLVYGEPGPSEQSRRLCKETVECYRRAVAQLGRVPARRKPAAPAPGVHAPRVVESRWKRLADELCLDVGWFERFEELLRDKGQVVLYGPPGTGKTFIAKHFARSLAGAEERVRVVQFHPAYTYEDFVEGYRPREGAGFGLVAGPLRELAEAAADDGENPYLLIVDEFNRGNLPKILGELYLLLEYRDEAVRLLYSRESFSLPRNLFLIGTMNTADRSIALVDAALRRRFHFLALYPDRWPIEGLLGRWLAKRGSGPRWLAAVVELANRKLADRDFAIGPAHFMRPDLDEHRIGLIWEHSVIPYLEEHFFDERSRVEAFALERLRQEAAGGG